MNRAEARRQLQVAHDRLISAGWTEELFNRLIDGLWYGDAVTRAEETVKALGLGDLEAERQQAIAELTKIINPRRGTNHDLT